MKKKRIAVFALALALTFNYALGANYEKVATKKLFNGEELHEYRLKNGLRVLILPRHRAKVLTYQTWFQVGSNDEKLDPKLNKTGIAHLFEHMMFRGTTDYPDGQFNEIISDIGGEEQNANTSFYRTAYFESVPSSHLETVVKLEADRMAHLNLTANLLKDEKGAVVGELRRTLDSPGRIAADDLFEEAYTLAPFRYTVLGTEDEIKGFSLQEAQYFYQTYYAPNNATIVVVGDTTDEELMKMIDKYYGSFASKDVPHHELPAEPIPKKQRMLEAAHPQATSQLLMVGYPIPPVTSADIIPLNLLAAHLTSGMEGRLRKLLVDKGIAVAAAGEVSDKPDLFIFSVQLAEGHSAHEALKVLDREIASLQSTPISQHAFERARNQELLDLYGSITDNSSMAGVLGEYLMLCGDYLRGLEIVEGYKQIHPSDLKRVAREYFKKQTRSIVIITPPKKGKS